MTRALLQDGWYRFAQCAASPNFDARPADAVIDLLVIHCISLPPGEYGGSAIDDLFHNRLDCDAHPYFDGLRGLRVSSHFLIRRDGALRQYVGCDDRAWHAGVSCFDGRERCNDFSIGIELEGIEGGMFEAAQYDSLHALVAALTAAYPLRAAASHRYIAPDRKGDPGDGFDWPRLARPFPQLRCFA